MNILSKAQTSIQISVSNQLSILQFTSVQTEITNLKLNLTIVQSKGQLGLICYVKGNLNINNYQIVGNYNIQGTIQFVGLDVQNSNVTINSVNIMSSKISGGNSSSFLVSYISESIIVIINCVVQQGTVQVPQLYNSIESTQFYYYQFGGIISIANSSQVYINNIIFDCQQQFSSQYVKNSGFIIGMALNQLNSLHISEICLYYSINSSSTFTNFGLFGMLQGYGDINQTQIIIAGKGSFNFFGVFGEAQCQYATLCSALVLSQMSVSITLQQLDGAGDHVAALISNQHLNCSIFDIFVYDTNFSGISYVGGIIGHTCYQTYIINCVLQNGNITNSGSYTGGIISHVASSEIIANNCTTQDTNITAIKYSGGLFGFYSVTKYNLNLIIDCVIYNLTESAQNCTAGILGYINGSITVKQTNVSKSVIQSVINCGGFVGFSYNTVITITNSKVSSIKVISTNNFGIIVGFEVNSEKQMTESYSEGSNYVNDVIQQNCGSFLNSGNINGC
ncbi:Hypothetical_protein [Hexamita inflata]|uniref:Hypothetical_protein n=1 Tax=Hexamita inflata TaxID=28002 RepID=A0AA86U418_9EUKA|nr:Hypothetical protein HINF_LOCUS17703 [Hexamita inflata]